MSATTIYHLVAALLLLTSSSAWKIPDNIIPRDYDIRNSPKIDGKPTSVKVHVTIQGIGNFNIKENTCDVNLFLALSWQDFRLNLTSPPLINESESYTVPSDLLEEIWHPKVYFKGAPSVTMFEYPYRSEFTWVYEENALVHLTKSIVRSPCKFSTKLHTPESFRIFIESLTEDETQMELKWGSTSACNVDEDFLNSRSGVTVELIEKKTFHKTYVNKTFSCVEALFGVRNGEECKEEE